MWSFFALNCAELALRIFALSVLGRRLFPVRKVKFVSA